MSDRMRGIFVLDLSKLSQEMAEAILANAEMVIDPVGHNWGMQKPERTILENDRELARLLRARLMD